VTGLALALVVIAAVAVMVLPPLHPAQIWSVVWALAVTSYSLKLLPYLTLGVRAQVLIGGASLAFIIGTFVGERLSVPGISRLHLRWAPSQMLDLSLAGAIALGLTCLGLVAFLLQAEQRYGLRAALVSSPQVRLAIQAGTFNITIKYVYAAVAASVLCGARAAAEPHRMRWAFGGLLAISSTYFTTGRSPLVIATVSALCAYALAAHGLPRRRSLILGAVAVAAIALAIFMVGGSVIGKTFENSELATVDSVFERHASLRWAALPYEYLSAPVAAFGLEASLSSRLPRTDGCASAGFICSILSHAGLRIKPFPQVRPFTEQPLRWNTYTSLDAPLLDGGIWLVIPAFAFVGMALGAIWAAARRRGWLAIVCYAGFAPAIVTASGSNGFTAPLILGAIAVTVSCMLGARIINQRANSKIRCGSQDS
jgi:oligosaccharide repeat unit polymerase